jgi:hypothetical protein
MTTNEQISDELRANLNRVIKSVRRTMLSEHLER